VNPQELLRLAARKAGVHLYTQTDCNVYANGPIVALHASHDGPIIVNTAITAQCVMQ
jgi:beta-galactosidase